MYPITEANMEIVSAAMNALGLVFGAISAYYTYVAARRCFRKGGKDDACS